MFHSRVLTLLALNAFSLLGMGDVALGQNSAEAEDNGPAGAFLARHCLACHEGDDPKGDLRLDQLSGDFADRASRERWLQVLERVRAGEMPPEEKPRPAEDEVRAFSEWVDGQSKAADARRAAEGRAVLRRLNRAEYENTVRDLLGIEIDLQDLLPPDTSLHGFDNIGEALHTS